MGIVKFPDCIRCTFNLENSADSFIKPNKTEVFFAHKKDFSGEYVSLEKYHNPDDRFKVERLKHNNKSSTLACYTLLRLVLSQRLKVKPEEISYFTYGRGKPGIKNSSLSFNISHSGDAFAFAISDNNGLGVDIEKYNKEINIKAVVERFFSAEERSFIFDSPNEASNLFFLLWTRKEALLKAFGTGIIPDLTQVEVHKAVNHLNRNFLSEYTDIAVLNDYFIYSLQRSGYFLSVAQPHESELKLTELNEDYVLRNFTL
jgi:phosphopantetheine--protein transferase-like protein